MGTKAHLQDLCNRLSSKLYAPSLALCVVTLRVMILVCAPMTYKIVDYSKARGTFITILQDY